MKSIINGEPGFVHILIEMIGVITIFSVFAVFMAPLLVLEKLVYPPS